jgi:Carboxypeptidase regulatory-like domain
MRNKRLIKKLVLLPLLLLATGGALKAQTIVTGAISGTVTDASGAAVPDAKVTLLNEATQQTQSANTGATGVYQFPLLKPGPYSLTVEKSGFRRTVQKADVLLGQTATVNVGLEVGEVSQTVEITGQAPLLQTEDGNITSNVDLRTLQSLRIPAGT